MPPYLSPVNAVLDLLMPHKCAGCSCYLVLGEEVLCTICRHELPLTGSAFPFEPLEAHFIGVGPFGQGSALLLFRQGGMVQHLVHGLKFEDQTRYGPWLGRWAVTALASVEHPAWTALVPIPLHPIRHMQRGYNQLDGFCRTLAGGLGVEYWPQAMRKRTTWALLLGAQSGRSKRARLKRQINPFFLPPSTRQKLAGRPGLRILLVDDVVTTGATLRHALQAWDQFPNLVIDIYTISVGRDY